MMRMKMATRFDKEVVQFEKALAQLKDTIAIAEQGRERSTRSAAIAVTNIEQAIMWLNKD